MSMLIRRRPAATALDVFERFFGEPWQDMSNEGRENEYALALDIYESDTSYRVVAAVPGVKSEDIDVRLQDNVLSITASVRLDRVEENGRTLMRERRYGQFSRSLRLPVPVSADGIEAVYENGVLTLHVPKVEAVHPRTIQVKATAN